MSTTVPFQGTGASPEGVDADTALLHSMGYAQELKRRMSGFSNFAVSFTIISILSGCLTLYGTAMTNGGPVDILWGWVGVGIMTTIVGLGMAEIASSYPTAGGLYYWSAKLSRNNGPVWSWFTGWFNLLGQVAVTAGIDFGCAQFILAFLNLTTGWNAVPHSHLIYVYAGVLIIHGMLNTFGIRIVAFLSNVSVWWHVLGVLIIAAFLTFVPSHHASTSFVFTKFINETGFHWTWYVFLIGLLMAQYTFTGYDASAHMSEETVGAAMKAPRGIVNSILVSLAAGFVLLFAITRAITTDYNSAIASTTGVPPVQIFLDAIGRHDGELLLLIVIFAQLFCGMASVTANSRMIYAFSRDGAVPGHEFWHRINPRTRTPTNSVWFAVTGAFILGLPYLINTATYSAVTSIAVIGLYIAYVIPTLLRRLNASAFTPGPWNLGKWSALVGWIGVVWVGFITVLFCLPTIEPIHWANFNFTIVAVGVVLLYSGGYWLLSARKWFTGPKAQGDLAELQSIERGLGG
ncbi:MAG TPA: amino acid permease [Acidimicrobiales bacterium]|nr:amino acid permease [Acidimicrobiales bacterium]